MLMFEVNSAFSIVHNYIKTCRKKNPMVDHSHAPIHDMAFFHCDLGISLSIGSRIIFTSSEYSFGHGQRTGLWITPFPPPSSPKVSFHVWFRCRTEGMALCCGGLWMLELGSLPVSQISEQSWSEDWVLRQRDLFKLVVWYSWRLLSLERVVRATSGNFMYVDTYVNPSQLNRRCSTLCHSAGKHQFMAAACSFGVWDSITLSAALRSVLLFTPKLFKTESDRGISWP